MGTVQYVLLVGQMEVCLHFETHPPVMQAGYYFSKHCSFQVALSVGQYYAIGKIGECEKATTKNDTNDIWLFMR
jgi:hypothetical protein